MNVTHSSKAPRPIKQWIAHAGTDQINGCWAMGSTKSMEVARSNCENTHYGGRFALHLPRSGSHSSGGRRIESIYIENTIRRWKFGREHQGVVEFRGRECQDLLYCKYMPWNNRLLCIYYLHRYSSLSLTSRALASYRKCCLHSIPTRKNKQNDSVVDQGTHNFMRDFKKM